MNRPYKLKKGDRVAIVSLSSGMLGEKFCSHNLEIGTRRLKEYGLEPVFMENALKGIEYHIGCCRILWKMKYLSMR